MLMDFPIHLIGMGKIFLLMLFLLQGNIVLCLTQMRMLVQILEKPEHLLLRKEVVEVTIVSPKLIFPLILALILGSLMENSFQIAMRAHAGIGWAARPVVLIIFALIVITIILSVRGITRNKQAAEDTEIAGEGSEKNPIISVFLSGALLAVFASSSIQSSKWPGEVRDFPLIAAICGMALVFFALINDARGAAVAVRQHGGFNAAFKQAADQAILSGAAVFFGYLIVMLLLMLLIGQKIVLPLFIFVYLMRWSDYGWRVALGYAAGGWILLVAFYDQVMSLFWYPSWLSDWLPDLLPAWLPKWLFV